MLKKLLNGAFELRSRTATRRTDLWFSVNGNGFYFRLVYQKWVVAASRTMSAPRSPGVSGAMVHIALNLWNMCDEPSDGLEMPTVASLYFLRSCSFAIILEELFFDMPNGVKPTSWLNIQLCTSQNFLWFSLKQKKKKKRSIFFSWLTKSREMEDRVRCWVVEAYHTPHGDATLHRMAVLKFFEPHQCPQPSFRVITV